MSSPDAELREQVARQLDELLSGPLATNGPRATIQLARYFLRDDNPTIERDRLWDQIEERYLALQAGVALDGRAALLTAGAPGAGKSTAVARLRLVGDGWRRLDADIVKDYLVQELVAAGDVDDVLAVQLADGRPVMPRELAGLVHAESVIILDRIRTACLRRGENVVIEGTLSWEPAGRRLLNELVQRNYHEVSIVDVEVPREVARAQAVARWWAGRCDPANELGGRWVPLSAIDRVYPDAHQLRSVCAANAQTLFDSDVVRDLPLARLTLVDTTGPTPVTETRERRSGVLQPRPGPQQLSLDTDLPMTAAQSARQSFPRKTISSKPGSSPTTPPAPPGRRPPGLSL